MLGVLLVMQEFETGNSNTVEGGFVVCHYGRFFAVYSPEGELVVVAVYRCGAVEVARRLREAHHGPSPTADGSTLSAESVRR